MKYTVIVLPTAERDIKDLPSRYRHRVIEIIRGLATEPYPSRSKQLRDPLAQFYRLPLDKYRIIYEILEDEAEILVHYIKLKTGSETYEGLE